MAGGYGGRIGYYHFESIEKNLNDFPINLSEFGREGLNGLNGDECETFARRVNVIHSQQVILLVASTTTQFFLKEYPDPKCFVKKLYVNAAWPKLPNKFKRLNFVSTALPYKEILLENMINPVLSKSIEKAYDAINMNSEPKESTLNDFLVESIMFEKHYRTISKHIDTIPFYHNLLKRIQNFANPRDIKLLDTDRKVLTLLYSSIYSKIATIQSDHKSDLIIDIVSFLSLIESNIKNFHENQKFNLIGKKLKIYNDGLWSIIQHAYGFIEDEIQPEIKKSFDQLNGKIKLIISESVTLKSNAIVEIQKKTKAAKIIRRNVMIRKTMEVIESVASFIFDVSKGAIKIAFGMSSLSAELTESFLTDPKINKILETFEGVRNMNTEFKKKNHEKLTAIIHELTELKEQVMLAPNLKVSNISLQQTNLMSEIIVPIYKFECESNDLIKKAEQMKTETLIGPIDISRLINETFTYLNKWKQSFGKASEKKFEQSLNVLAVIQTSSSIYNEYSSETDQIDEIGIAINEDKNSLNALIMFEAQINDDLLPIMGDLQTNIEEISSSLANMSSVSLDVIQWKIGDKFRRIQKKLQKAVSGFTYGDDAVNYLSRINEAINLIINIFDRIQDYYDQSKLAAFVSELDSISYQNLNINDAELESQMNELQLSFLSNVIRSQYYRAIDALKQTVFPFADDYLKTYELPSVIASNDTDALITTTIESLRMRIKEFNATVINQNDESVHIAEFSNEPGSEPFYVWQNSEVCKQIQAVFNGSKVYLLADITKSNARNAIKFSTINLEFRSNYQTINDQLSKILQSFHVTLTHLGESHYRCNNKFYTISSRPLKIEFSFGKKNQQPIDRTISYEKLQASSKFLSPYTLWSVQLTNGPFDKLERFTDFVNIELHGNGQYLEQNATICNTNLEKYYSLKVDI